MARHLYTRPRRKRRASRLNPVYVILVLLIIITIAAFKWGHFGKDKTDPNDVNAEPNIVKETEEKPPAPAISYQPAPELPMPEPNLPDVATSPDVTPS